MRPTGQGARSTKRRALALAGALLLAAGCAGYPPREEGPRVERARAPAPPRWELAGVVESVRPLALEAEPTPLGAAAGGVIGGTIGGEVGRGRGAAAGAVVGGVLGSVAGEAAGAARTQPGVEITVRLDDGRAIAVRQPAGESFRPGERVRVVSDGTRARVTR